MYLDIVDDRYKLMKGRRPGFGIANAMLDMKFKRCGWLWRKWAIYETDPETINVSAVGGSVGWMVRITPRFKTTLECVNWLEAQPVEPEYDGWEVCDE